MILILKQENIDTKRIKFKLIRSVIKLTYDLDYLLLIGITITVSAFKIKNIFNKMCSIELQDNKQIDKLKEIDNYIDNNIKNYKRFLNDDNSIKIKLHNNLINSNRPLNITINNLKKVYDYYKVQIYTL
tara:strand:- start:709 stop:1095 length:387 start_codon:yes stop_codon:yes gene_type:complete